MLPSQTTQVSPLRPNQEAANLRSLLVVVVVIGVVVVGEPAAVVTDQVLDAIDIDERLRVAFDLFVGDQMHLRFAIGVGCGSSAGTG